MRRVRIRRGHDTILAHSCKSGRSCAACSNLQGDILLAIHHERDGRTHAARNAGLEFQQLFTLVGRIGIKRAASGLEHDATASSNGAAANGRAPGNAPSLGSGSRVVRQEEAAVDIGANRFELGPLLSWNRRSRGSAYKYNALV